MTMLVCQLASVLVCNTCGATSRAERTPAELESSSAVKHMERAVSVGWAVSDEKTDADQCPTCCSAKAPPKRSGVFRIVRPHTANDAHEKPAPSMASRVRECLTTDHNDDTESPS